jgi:outer membrane cobalamin receptor
MQRRRAVLSVALLFGALGHAAGADTDQDAPVQGDSSGVSMDVDVVAKRLDIARQQIQPSLGATTYNFSPQALQDIPRGENAPLNQVLLQAPGVAQDSFGQIHLRGEHANVQYRINGVELPEGLSVFGQALTSRFADSISLITGALPAQYGFQTAGVVDIQTKTGITSPGLALSMYGGQQQWLQPSFEYGGRSGPVDWFVLSASKIRPPVSTRSTTPPINFTAWPTPRQSSIPIQGSA